MPTVDRDQERDLRKCSFCGKSQNEVVKLVAGPGVYICDQCIDLCSQIMADELSDRDSDPSPATVAASYFRSWMAKD